MNSFSSLIAGAMFSPEMMKTAQSMMANMSPEDMQRMTQMAANMDPSVMAARAYISNYV